MFAKLFVLDHALTLDLYQTVALAVVVLALGTLLRKKISFFQKYCIPAPVIGGLIFAILALILHVTGVLTFNMDETMKGVFMTLFFTSVGFTASLPLLKKGGIGTVIFVGVAIVLVIGQDIIGILMAKAFGLDPTLGLCCGSISMVGGHGTSASFGPMLEKDFGVEGATTVAVAAATFGLVSGGLIGGPIARRLITKHNLTSTATSNKVAETVDTVAVNGDLGERILKSLSMLFLAAGIGMYVAHFIAATGVTFPTYIGAMLVGAIIRNIGDLSHKFTIDDEMISNIGNACLSLFLAIALMTLKLWQLADLAIPMIAMLLGQVIFMALFTYFVVFNIMGRDYEAAVMSSATCGFGMGATPNAIANMQAITALYGPAPKAFFIVPLVGSLFIDFFNGGILTFLINMIK